MRADIGPWDLALLVLVSIQATVLAYMHAPKWKATVLSLPIPFTTIAMGLGRPVGSANVLALFVLLIYMQGVRVLHQRLRLPIVLSIGLSLLAYCAIGWVLARALPAGESIFWVAAAVTFAFALALHLLMPYRREPGHRTPLPVWKKLPLIVAVICLLILVKGALQGFATLFPLLGVVGAYEARHSLWTFARQVPVLMLAMVPLMVVSHVTQDYVGLGPSLALGWPVFLCALVFITRTMWAKAEAIQEQEPFSE